LITYQCSANALNITKLTNCIKFYQLLKIYKHFCCLSIELEYKFE